MWFTSSGQDMVLLIQRLGAGTNPIILFLLSRSLALQLQTQEFLEIIKILPKQNLHLALKGKARGGVSPTFLQRKLVRSPTKQTIAYRQVFRLNWKTVLKTLKVQTPKN